MAEHTICSTDELDVGERIITDIEGREIAVFNVKGEYIAAANYCVHAGGPICEGRVTGTVTAEPDTWEWDWDRDDEIIACPWHGWEFDLLSGKNLSLDKYRLITYETLVRDGEVIVETHA